MNTGTYINNQNIEIKRHAFSFGERAGGVWVVVESANTYSNSDDDLIREM
jgi:hypothetical protein